MKKIIITALALTITSAFAQVIPKVDDNKGLSIEALDFQHDAVLKGIKDTKTFTIAVSKSSGLLPNRAIQKMDIQE